LPNSPQAGSEMLNNMVASFSASNKLEKGWKQTGNKLKKRTKRNRTYWRGYRRRNVLKQKKEA
jgi:hypothetical protein